MLYCNKDEPFESILHTVALFIVSAVLVLHSHLLVIFRNDRSILLNWLNKRRSLYGITEHLFIKLRS